MSSPLHWRAIVQEAECYRLSPSTSRYQQVGLGIVGSARSHVEGEGGVQAHCYPSHDTRKSASMDSLVIPLVNSCHNATGQDRTEQTGALT
jgi:hypothetical protein